MQVQLICCYFAESVLSLESETSHQSDIGTPLMYWSRSNDRAPTISSEANIAPATHAYICNFYVNLLFSHISACSRKKSQL